MYSSFTVFMYALLSLATPCFTALTPLTNYSTLENSVLTAFVPKWYIPVFKPSKPQSQPKMICIQPQRLHRLARIVNGTQVRRDENFMRWRVRIGTNPEGLPTRDHCGGTIISPHLVLTAAHCLQPYSKFPFFIYYDTVSPNDHSTRFAQADAIAWHEKYVGRNESSPSVRFEHDIGLLHFQQPLNFSGKARAACLPWSFNNFPENVSKVETPPRNGIASGWGMTTLRTSTTQHSHQSCDLLKVQLSAMSTTECNDWYEQLHLRPAQTNGAIGSRKSFPRMRLTNDMFCAGPIHKDAVSDFGLSGCCLGDSGGGFDYELNEQFYVVGIISTVYLGICGQRFPNKFIKTSNYLPWIEAYASRSGYQFRKYCS